MANIKKRLRILARLKEKYTVQGGSPRKLRRKAEVEKKRQAKEVSLKAIPADAEAVIEVSETMALVPPEERV